MTEEQLSHITEPFYRTDKSRSRGEGGTGLGLAFCKQIALAHGELAHYNNSIVCFNTALAAYGSYCRRAQGCGDKGSWLFG